MTECVRLDEVQNNSVQPSPLPHRPISPFNYSIHMHPPVTHPHAPPCYPSPATTQTYIHTHPTHTHKHTSIHTHAHTFDTHPLFITVCCFSRPVHFHSYVHMNQQRKDQLTSAGTAITDISRLATAQVASVGIHTVSIGAACVPCSTFINICSAQWVHGQSEWINYIITIA